MDCRDCGETEIKCSCQVNNFPNMTIKEVGNDTLLGKARAMMKVAHAGQTRWNGEAYKNHPERVEKQLERWKIKDEDMLAAAFLHDTIEDSDITVEIIAEKINERVADLVDELTTKDRRKYFDEIKAMSMDAKVIKFADVLDNVTDMDSDSDDVIRTQKYLKKKVRAIRILAKTVQEYLENELYYKS